MKIDGFVSKKNIRRLLVHYQALENGDQLPTPPGASVNSGPKCADGISGGRLNKIMLDDAIGKLTPFMQTVVKCRWTQPLLVRDACKVLGISRDVYRHRQDLAVEQIYIQINGGAAGIVRLYAAIDKIRDNA